MNGLKIVLLCNALASTACTNLAVEQKNKTADAQFLQAQQMATIGQTEDAINKITELSKQYPENPQYRNWLKVQQDREESTRLKNASLLVEQQDFAAAEATYQKILLENPYQQAAMDGLELSLIHI